MTNCTMKQVELKSIKRKKVSVNFSGGMISSDAGVMLLREAAQKTGILNRVAECINDPRNQDLIIHEIKTMLEQRVYGIACGYEDLNDHQLLRKDPTFKLASNKASKGIELASASTLCRLEKRIMRRDMVAISKILVEQFIGSYKKAPKEIILDFDTTDDEIHGEQEGRFFHGYYDNYCYLPLYVFSRGQLLAAYLRPSNIDAAKHSGAILKLMVQRIRESFPEVRIIFRGDSGFCRKRIMSWCERNDVKYVIGIGKNSRLENAARSIIDKSRQIYKQTNQKVRIFGELSYGARSWKQQRRIIVKAEQLEKGENIRYIVTNMDEIAPRKLYDKKYIKRGDMENRIKEQQLDLFADRTSCRKFLSNQFRLLLASLAYVLMDYIRRVGLKGTSLAKAQCGSIRLKLLKVGGLVLENTRKIVIQLSQFYVYQDIFRLVAMRLR